MANGILFFTDFHAHLFQEFAKADPDYYTDRFKEQCGVLDAMLSKASEENLEVVFGGDLFHKRGAVDVRVFNKVYGIFSKYASRIPHTYLLRGNHDSYDNSMGSVSSLDTFTTLPNTTVISMPESFETTTTVTVNGDEKRVKLFFMPYGENIQDMKDKLKEFSLAVNSNNYNILVAHLGVDGAKQGRSVHRLAGAFTLDDMHADAFDYVYLGHFHARQKLAPNVFYGGSTMQLSFNDEGQEKGYDVLTHSGFKFFPVHTHQFITLTDWGKKSQELAKDNYIRLQVSKSVAKEALEAGAPTVRVEAKADTEAKMRIDITAEDSPERVVSKYTDTYYPKQKQLALDILKKALDD